MTRLQTDMEKLTQVNTYVHKPLLKEIRMTQEAEEKAKLNEHPQRDKTKYYINKTLTNC